MNPDTINHHQSRQCTSKIRQSLLYYLPFTYLGCNVHLSTSVVLKCFLFEQVKISPWVRQLISYICSTFCLGNIVVILSNEEGSKNLTAHSLYNSSIRLVKTNDFLQDLAANGRLFSMWQELTSHQLSHLRRTIKTVLNLKSVIRWRTHVM